MANKKNSISVENFLTAIYTAILEGSKQVKDSDYNKVKEEIRTMDSIVDDNIPIKDALLLFVKHDPIIQKQLSDKLNLNPEDLQNILK